MSTVSWEAAAGEILLWLTYDYATETVNRFPVLRMWVEQLLFGRPYAILDDMTDPWAQQYVKENDLPHALLPDPPNRFLLAGSKTLDFLRAHEDHSGDLWISGLRVLGYASYTDLLDHLSLCNGRSIAEMGRSDLCLFTLGTYADAECLIDQPGLWGMKRLLNECEAVASRSGFRWTAL